MARKDRSAPDEATYARATEEARTAASPGDWLSLALDHHDQIRSAFERGRLVAPDGSRITALKGLALLLTGHSIAEEAVLYPALAIAVTEDDAESAYHEQSLAKIQMGELERTHPADPRWIEKLETIRSAVLQHMFEEETGWFLELRQSPENHAKLTARYKEEFERYTRTGAIATNAAWDGPPRAAAVTA